MSSVFRVTTGTQRFVSVIAKAESSATLENIQFLFHVSESSTSQLINCISNDLLKSLKHFNGTTIFTPFFLPPFRRVPIRLDLYLKDDELSVLTLESSSLLYFGCSSLLNCHKLPEVSE